MSGVQLLSRREFTLGSLLVATGLAGAACGSPGAPETGGVLRIGQFFPPTSLDPAKAGGESQLFLQPAYDPLIYRAPDGSYQPRLATSWGYLGKDNKTFQLTLRQGVVFSDGSPLTAAAVKAGLEHFQSSAGQVAAFLRPITSIEADGQVLRLSCDQPHPLLPMVFTQDFLAGDVISGAALTTSDQLATRTFGAGPYVLLPEETVSGDHYAYGPNPKCWNAQARRFDKIVVKVLPNENTALAALKTAQVDAVIGTYAIADGARAAGLGIATNPDIVIGLQLNDRTGALCRPLGDVRVRQALNFAVDRQKITAALLGGYGIATEQPAAPGQDGWNDTNFYRHDPDRARGLLRDAGYPNGFSLAAVIPSAPAAPADMAQAIASDLEQVGVTLQIAAKEPTAANAALTQYPVSIMGWGVLPVYFMGRGLWLRDAVGMNPFHSSDPTLEDLDRRAAAADERTRADLDRQIVRRVVELGWFLPICLSPQFLFHRNTVDVEAVRDRPFPSVVAWHPAGSA
ncbi:MAG TPA: ABC transporter substrate-binding protein [Kutzneria sp.]|jgi:ABC-type transport system substrate-binding protein|nr:ABC transporter substrate-binding protein [Kutzneria sp.]